MMPAMTLTRSSILVLLCTLALPAAAQVYRWVDKNGQVHYSSAKPPEVKVDELKIQSANSLGGEASATAAPTSAPVAAPIVPNDPNAALQREVQTLNKQRCSAAKAIAARYEGAPYLEKANADGSKARLTPEAEAGERARIKSDVASACGSGG